MPKNLKMRLWAVLGSVVLVAGGVSCGTREATQPQGADHSAHSSPMDGAGMAHGDMMSMDLGPKDESFDLRFIDGMMLHHQGAIAMAESAQANSSRPEIKQLANDIITAQQQEISQMQQWRKAWYPDAGAEPTMYSAEMGHMMAMPAEMQTAMRMDMDLGKADQQFDQRFIDAMIPHHEGALDMAKEALEKSDRPEIRQLAENILSSQQQEIDQMQQWRKAWYGQ
ncbi:MAG TPA: DUF305 domain-containing protein [Leptolyngbyaceae cyanobacterium]